MDSPQSPTDPAPAAPVPPSNTLVRSNLRTITAAWVFGAFWLWIVSGAVFTRFARALGTPEWGFGVMTAVPYIACLAQFLTIFVRPPGWNRKKFFMITCTASRLLWTVVGLLPWILPAPALVSWWFPAMASLILLSWVLANMATPVWMEWMSDVIPNKVRGRFFAMRNRIGMFIGLIATFGTGWVLDRVTLAPDALNEHQNHQILLRATSAIIAISGLIGMLDILLFRKIRDDFATPPAVRKSALEVLREPLLNPHFRTFLQFNFTLNMGLGFIGQYIWLYVFDVVGMSNKEANLLLIAIPLMVMAASYQLWGRLIDRLGTKPVIVFCWAIYLNGAWGWILYGHKLLPMAILGHSFYLMDVLCYALILLCVFCWPGMEIAIFNIILSMSGSKSVAGSGASYVAVNSIAVALGGIISGLIAGLIAKYMADWHQTILNVPLSYHSLLLLLSTLIRILALIYAIRLVEPKPTRTRDAFRYITSDIYNNMIQTFYTPIKLASELTTMNRLGRLVSIRTRLSQIRKAAKVVIDLGRE